MMNSLLFANTTPTDLYGAFVILSLLPPEQKDAYTASLNALVSEKQAATDALEQTRQATADNEKRATALATAQRALADDQDALDRRTKKFTDESTKRSDALAGREADVSAREQAADAREKDADARDASLTAKAADLDAREAAVTDREAKADAMIADYSSRLAKLKQLAD